MSTPRKNTSTRRARAAIAAIFTILIAGVVLAPLLSSTGNPVGVVDSGYATETACDRDGFSQADGGMCWGRPDYHLIVKDADGHEWRVVVGEEVFWDCFAADRYPACAQKGGRS